MTQSKKKKVEPVIEEQPWETLPGTAPMADSTGKLPPQQSDWTADESGEPVPVEPTADDWASVPAPLTLNIERHVGFFDPSLAKILIYGETGTEKTRTAATFPNVIFADIDHGMSSVDWEVDKVYIADDNTGFDTLRELYRMLKTGEHEYETVVLDTLNEMQRIIMRFTIEEYTHVRRSYGNLPGQSDYGKMLYEFLELTRDFIALPMRVVLLAQVNSRVFDTDILMPQLIGKNSAREILRKMDVVGYIYKGEGEGERKVPTISFDGAEFVTKDRSNRLPAVLTNPDYDRMSAFWK